MKSASNEPQEKESANHNNSPFDFSVDKTTRIVVVTMAFNAELELVWDSFTRPELLDQWYAPRPWTSRTRYMDFRVGGKRFYAMVSPEGEERWAVQKYTSITPKTNFRMWNVFTDKDENPEPSGSDWDLTFSEQNDETGSPLTTVRIEIYNESLERLERVLEGFRIGMTMTYENLKNLLASLTQR